MPSLFKKSIETIYPVCSSILGQDLIAYLVEDCAETLTVESFCDILLKNLSNPKIPDFLPDLAMLECTIHNISKAEVDIPKEAEEFIVNPTLEVLNLSWKLSSFLNKEKTTGMEKPQKGQEWVVVWQDPESGKTNFKAASREELLAIKIIVDEISPEDAASDDVSAHKVYSVLAQAAANGLIIPPHSRIRRDPASFSALKEIPERYLSAGTFTLQWHITNACDLHCKHCYDRSKRSHLNLEQAIKVLDQMSDFCRKKHVEGHVCLSGGNPFLYPYFFEIYSSAAERGFSISILGNPVPKEKMEKVISIQMPTYFQVSIEGLEEHNNKIRGRDHYASVMKFLGVLKEFKISPAIMLTLTKDNINQALLLADILRDKTDYFTFNRLSQVGEGAELQLPAREEYQAFLASYVDAAQDNPIMGFKDNLINIVLHQRGMKTFNGCTGYGCGAAFNFIVVLPDGEVHACRKFPSLIGNVLNNSINEIYDSDIAQRYRVGSRACMACAIKHVCGGCLAITNANGIDIFKNRDPYCFINTQQ